MPEVNAVGDLVLTTPEEFRALADALAIALTDHLRRSAPVSVSSVDRTLEELEQVGIVTSAEDGWRAVANGVVFEIRVDASDRGCPWLYMLRRTSLLHA